MRELNWPTSSIGPPPGAREIRVACIASLVLACVILAFGLFPARQGGTRLGYDEDFVAFYGIGRLLNEHPPERLYDFPTQGRIYVEYRPEVGFLGLPYVHAPFEALVFQPLARLPFRGAYVAWLGLGLAAYGLALALMLWRFGPADPGRRWTTVLVALAFPPFLMEAWLGGNITVIGCLGLASAIALTDAGRPWLAGAALAVCMNKPTLLVLVLPMLLLSGQWRVLAGFTMGLAGLVVASSLVLGWQTWPEFVAALVNWARMTSAQADLFRDWKYVDLNAFTRVLPWGRSRLAVLITALASVGVFIALVRQWWALRHAGRTAWMLGWSATIAWTLVLNAYVPIYDCTVLMLAGLLTAAALRDAETGDLPLPLVTLITLCVIGAWLTQPIAQVVRLQIYTPILTYAGLFLLQRLSVANAGERATSAGGGITRGGRFTRPALS